MFSDRPGTTPKSLDLVVSPTCLREKERELLDDVCGLVGGVKGTPIISQVWPTPTFCPVADSPRYPGGPSAFEFLHCHPTETASGKFFPTQADYPQIYGGLSAPCSVANHRCIRSLPDEPMISGPYAVLWRTVRSVILRLRTSLQSLW